MLSQIEVDARIVSDGMRVKAFARA